MSSDVAELERIFDGVPDGWTDGSVLDFFQLQRGHDLPVQSRKPGSVPVIASNGAVGWHDHSPLTGPGVITGRSGTIGNVSYNEGAYWPLNTTLYVRDFKGSDPKFVYYFLQHFPLSDHQSGTGVPTLNRNDVHAARTVFPPLDEQRRIAEVLRSVDEAVAAQSTLCSHLRQTADDLADELYAHEITDCGSDLVAYGDACETVQVGIVIRPASHYVDDGGVPALRSTNIKRNEIDFSALVQLSHEGHAINKKSALRAGDVVTIRTGEPGKTAVIPQDAPSPLNCIDIIFSRPKPELRPHFASYFINSGTARRQIGAMQGGLAQQHFNVGEMKKLKLPVPTLARQDRVIAVLDGAWRAVQLEEAQLLTLQSTKQALMSDLLSGRVRVPA